MASICISPWIRAAQLLRSRLPTMYNSWGRGRQGCLNAAAAASFICATVKQIQIGFLYEVPSVIHNSEGSNPGLGCHANKLPRERRMLPRAVVSDTAKPLPLFLLRFFIPPYLTMNSSIPGWSLSQVTKESGQRLFRLDVLPKAHDEMSNLIARCDLWSCRALTSVAAAVQLHVGHYVHVRFSCLCPKAMQVTRIILF